MLVLQSCALYWPEEYGYTEEYGPLSVELLSSSEADVDVTVRVFKLSHTIKVNIGFYFTPDILCKCKYSRKNLLLLKKNNKIARN